MDKVDSRLRAPLVQIARLALQEDSSASRGGVFDLRGYGRLIALEESLIFIFLRGEIVRLTKGDMSVRRVSPQALKRPTVGAVFFATCPSSSAEGIVMRGSTELFPFAIVAAYSGYIPQLFK